MILIVLPAYNEAAGLPALLRSIRQVMDEGRLTYKVVVVDDGSADGTWEAITAPATEMPIVPVRHETNRGLAEALRSGLQVAVAEAGPDDVIVDLMTTTGMTPVPLTPLDAYLERSGPEYRTGLPGGEPPLLLTPPPPAPDVLRRAVREALGGSLIVVGGDGFVVRDGDEATGILEGPLSSATFELPPGSKVVAERRFPGSVAVNVGIIDLPGSAAQR